jgi:hypothetical protein
MTRGVATAAVVAVLVALGGGIGIGIAIERGGGDARPADPTLAQQDELRAARREAADATRSLVETTQNLAWIQGRRDELQEELTKARRQLRALRRRAG